MKVRKMRHKEHLFLSLILSLFEIYGISIFKLLIVDIENEKNRSMEDKNDFTTHRNSFALSINCDVFQSKLFFVIFISYHTLAWK